MYFDAHKKNFNAKEMKNKEVYQIHNGISASIEDFMYSFTKGLKKSMSSNGGMADVINIITKSLSSLKKSTDETSAYYEKIILSLGKKNTELIRHNMVIDRELAKFRATELANCGEKKCKTKKRK